MEIESERVGPSSPASAAQPAYFTFPTLLVLAQPALPALPAQAGVAVLRLVKFHDTKQCLVDIFFGRRRLEKRSEKTEVEFPELILVGLSRSIKAD